MEKQIDKFNKEYFTHESSGITQTKQKKDITKVIKILQNREFFWKKTSGKFTSQKAGIINFIGPLMSAGLTLMKNVLTLLGKSILVPLGFTATASITNAGIQKKIFGPGATELIISNEEMEGIIKIVKSLKESIFLIKAISKTINNKARERKDGFLPVLLGILAASILEISLRG